MEDQTCSLSSNQMTLRTLIQFRVLGCIFKRLQGTEKPDPAPGQRLLILLASQQQGHSSSKISQEPILEHGVNEEKLTKFTTFPSECSMLLCQGLCQRHGYQEPNQNSPSNSACCKCTSFSP